MLDVVDGFAALADSAPGYETAHSYYDGTKGEVFGSHKLKRLLARQGSEFRVNVIKTVVDAPADRLELVSAVVPGDDVATKQLADIMADNSIEFESGNVHHRACEFGDAYVMVWDGVEEGDGPVVNYHSPLGMRVMYDPDNPRRKLYAAHTWKVKSPLGEAADHWRVNLLYPDRVERWRSTLGGKPEEVAGWEPAPATEDPDSWTEPNPYGEVPVFHFRNGTPYGVPVHYDGYGAQDAITKIVVSHMSTLDYHIAPQRYALVTEGEVDDELDLDDDPEFDDVAASEREDAASRAGLKSGPAEVWWLRNVAEVGQFEPAKAETFTAPAKFYVAMMAQTTKTPLDMLDQSGDEPSGESRRRKDAPLRDKVRTLAKMYAATWVEVFAFALKVAGFDGRTVKVSFAPFEVVSDTEGWATIKSKIENGVPVRVALLEAGYSEEQVEEWFPEDEENRLRVADLLAVSDVLQKLGSAVALGILTAEEARELLPEGVLPDAVAPPAPSIPQE
jgi:hypothetical protein